MVKENEWEARVQKPATEADAVVISFRVGARLGSRAQMVVLLRCCLRMKLLLQ